ncbi:exopolysaccharide Pel transporter PelG [Hydrogenothermus marinus]|uniref:Putative membrane protein n=1 Tax=Hydrogenothermus marinus TaxID=133270 RepID=A0A3M0BKA8_9AQUI|nr:exopolysaccharide Pel transporter PelG [Hydrogenothermus marinus]RMA97661.1 putative membrane protein [Hydrogenothermus marinus]
MAGIGFELRKILKKNKISSLFEAYGYAAILSAGGWVISILAIILVGLINISIYGNSADIIKFQVSVTYLISLSLILSGFHQLVFTRFVADRIYEGKEEEIVPNFFGILTLNTALSLLFSIIYIYLFLKDVKNIYFVTTFLFSLILLSNLWIINILAISVKKYRYVVLSYFFSYLLIIVFSYFIGYFGLAYLLISFFLGNLILFILLLYLILKNYQFFEVLSFDFIKAYKQYFPLALAGFFFNLGIWADEYIFWYSPLTGEDIIGKIRSSVVYDLPLFLAYLSIIPGMAVFFLRLEADFAEYYEKYFKGVVEGATLETLVRFKEQMIDIVRISIKEAIVLQGIFNIILYITAPLIFSIFNLPSAAIPLFYIDMIATQLQLLVMNILAILFYLDRRYETLIITIIMAVFNIILPIITIILGPYYYGYGTALAMLIASTIGLIYLDKVMRRLEYETFMLQR